jgi:hypothetical protein
MDDLIKPITVSITTMEGEARSYIISRLPALQAREIVAQYVPSALPKIGDYTINESMMLKLISYTAVEIAGGQTLRLTTKELINNHVPDWETLAKLEIEMMNYNTSFFKDGKISGFFEGIAQRATGLVTKTLMDLLQQSSAKN